MRQDFGQVLMCVCAFNVGLAWLPEIQPWDCCDNKQSGGKCVLWFFYFLRR